MARRLAAGSHGVAAMVAHAVCSAFPVPPMTFRSRTRSNARIARARQVAIYLAHIGFGLGYDEAGRLFRRDGTAAAHACRLVEDRRDDPRFDASLDCLEHALRARLRGVVGTVEA